MSNHALQRLKMLARLSVVWDHLYEKQVILLESLYKILTN